MRYIIRRIEMGTYFYVARKRPIDVRINDEVVKAYPLEYFCKAYDVRQAWDGLYARSRWVDDYYRGIRVALGRAIRAMEDVNVEYVFTNSMDSPIKPLSGSEVYRFTNGIPLDNVAYLDEESSCCDGPSIFHLDYESVGERVGALVRPVRVGRKLGPWTVEPYEDRHWNMAHDEGERLAAKQRARKAGRAA